MRHLLEGTLQLRGLKTGFLESKNKDKPVLLFLHGFPDSPHIFTKLFWEFADRYHIIAPFMRGAGPSIAGDFSRYKPSGLVLDHLEMINTLTKKKGREIFIISHDLGVPQALNLAPYLGEELKGLVIINGLSIAQMLRRIKSPKQLLKSWYIFLFQVPYLSDLLLEKGEDFFYEFAQNYGRFPKNLKSEHKKGYLAKTFYHYRSFAQSALNSHINNPKPIAQKTLILWGHDDKFVIPPTRYELQKYFLDFTVRILRGGHWLFLEDPVKTNRLIADFFEEIHYEKTAKGA